MMHRWLKRGLPLLALLALTPWMMPSATAEDSAEFDSGSIDHPGSYPGSPDSSPTARKSHVDDYRYMPDQVYIKPTDGLVKVLRTNQKIEVNDYDVAVFPLANADRREIRNVLREVTGIEGGRAEVWQDKVGKSGTAVMVVAPKYMIPYLKDAVAALDVPWLAEYNDGAVDAYIKVQNRKAADVDLIASTYAGEDATAFSTVDTTNNALRRFDEAYRQDEYAKAVKLVDIPCNQVDLDVKMYEVTTSNDLKLGTDYVAWKNGPGRNLFDFAYAGYASNQRAKNMTSVFDPFIDAGAVVFNNGAGKDQVEAVAANEVSRSVNYLLPSSYIDFLQAKGKARVITSANLVLCSANGGSISAENSVLAFVNNKNEIDAAQPPVSPEVLVRSNNGEFSNTGAITPKASNIQGVPGRDVPVGFAPSGVAVPDSSRRLNYTSAGSTGITVNVTPYVGLESMELELNIQIGELNGFAPSGLPIINTRTVSTTVRLLDGQPFVIAGLKKVNNSENSNKAPFLGSIPVVGYLFGGEQTLKRGDDVVMTVTPKFYTSSQINIATPPVIDTMDLVVNDKAPQGAPNLKFGFDQYLIGS